MKGKQRLSASVDAELLAHAQQALDEGATTSISAWVNDALRLKVEQDRRLQALAGFVSAYEAEHGTITAAEVDAAAREARSRAVVVRPAGRERSSESPRRHDPAP